MTRIRSSLCAGWILWSAFAVPAAVAEPDPSGRTEFVAGRYIISSALGEFDILSAQGLGTADDPLIVIQRLTNVSPATLMIRFDDPRFVSPANAVQSNFLITAITLITINRTGRAWVGFDFELQQEFERASVFQDGLSFDQMQVLRRRPIGSDRFGQVTRDLEPYDRLMFLHGGVDPGDKARFDINIIDLTPTGLFYLKQMPRLPSS